MYASSYIADLKDRELGDLVMITGQYFDRRDHKDRVSIGVRDITGTTFAALHNEQIAEIKGIAKLSRIRVWGRIDRSRDGRTLVIPQADRIADLGSLKAAFGDLDSEMREYASRMFVSRVSSSCVTTLRESNFDEFESKVISSEWTDGGLEPLQVKFPGFGNAATLTTSPNAQVMDFLNATGADRAFTVSLAFTSTFRHPNNAAETKVIVAKAVDLELTELRSLAMSLCVRALGKLHVTLSDPPSEEVLDAEWPAGDLGASTTQTLKLVQYASNILTSGTGWRTMLLERIIHVIGRTGLVLLDGSVERIGERTVSTMAIYPARFLSLMDTQPPRRQLNDLNEYKSWHS